MAAQMPQQRRFTEVIDLVSSDDDPSQTLSTTRQQLAAHSDMDSDSGSEDEASPLRRALPRTEIPESDILGPQRYTSSPEPARHPGGAIVVVDGEQIWIPDEDEPAEVVGNVVTVASSNNNAEELLALQRGPTITLNDCLQQVLDIFPDISHDYVTGLYNDFDREGDYETLPGPARLENIIEQLVSATSYPKQEKSKKRKRQPSVDEDSDKQWEREDRNTVPHYLKGSMQAMLKTEFPDIPVQYINDTLATHKHLYQAFLALAKSQESPDPSSRPYGKGRPSIKYPADLATIVANSGWPVLLDELNAARRRMQRIREERAAEEAKKMAEQENLYRAMNAGETAECSACFDDLPMNRQIHCDGSIAHFTCFDCAETYVKSEIGESRCRVLCPAGCGSGFVHNQLNLLSDKQSLEKLAQLQQEKDIRDAGLENLEECPFCDFKMIVPPIDEDFEFRCAGPECQKVSCRRCKAISHIPISCEQHAKDNKVNHRHKIEEAMTAAMVRSCNNCKKQFIKDYGCNKMHCPSCGNLQCYVCSTTIKDYNHFDQQSRGLAPAARTANKTKLCPLYDNVEERHEREVKEAEAAAIAQVVEQNPDVDAEDLDIKVSEAVNTATANRIRQAGGAAGGYGAWAAVPPPMPRAFEFFDDGDRIRLDAARQRAQARRRRADDNIARADQVLADMNARRDGHRMVGNNFVLPAPQPPAAAAYGQVPPLRGVQGFGDWDPGLRQPTAVRQRPHAAASEAIPQQAYPGQAPAPAPYNFDFGGDGAQDMIQARQNQPAHHNARNDNLQAHFSIMQRALQQRAAVHNENDNDNQPQQIFGPGIRNQRQNFQGLEMLRQQHDEVARERLMQQQQLQAQRQLQMMQAQQRRVAERDVFDWLEE